VPVASSLGWPKTALPTDFGMATAEPDHWAVKNREKVLILQACGHLWGSKSPSAPSLLLRPRCRNAIREQIAALIDPIPTPC